MPLGLGSNLSRAISKPITPGIVTDNLVLKHNYNAGSVVPISDGSVYTDGANDNINFGPLDMPSGAFTIGGWFWFASGQLEERPSLIGRATWAGTAKGFLMRFNNDSSASDTTALQVVMGDATSSGNNQTDVYSTTIVRDQWNHIMVTVDGEASGSKTLKCYLNGALDSTHTSVHYVPDDTSTTDFLIHKADNMNAGDSEVKGYACNCALWQTDLTQSQIKSIMNKNYAGLTSSEKTNLVSWWNLNASYSSSDGDTNVVFDNYHSGGESLGSEMVIDGSFNNNATSWTVDTSNDSAVSILNNAVTVTNSGTTGYGSIQQTSTDFVDGNYYKLTFDVTALTTSDGITVYNYNSNLTKTLESITTPVTITDYFLASNTDGVDIRAICSSGESITIDNISVKQVNGNTGTLS